MTDYDRKVAIGRATTMAVGLLLLALAHAPWWAFAVGLVAVAVL